MCSYGISSIQDNDEDIEEDEELNLDNLVNSFMTEILSFNYDVIKFLNLIINTNIFKKNIGFI